MPSVLIVENDRDLQTLLERYLKLAGYQVFAAEGGREALRLIEATYVNLVITTLVMEDLDGIELIQDLRAGHPRVKIIAIAGGGLLPPATYLDAARVLGADAGFSKPISIPDLLQTIRQLVSPSSAYSQELRRLES